jgi:hypothetical protein
MLKRLIKTGRGEWLDIEMEKLADPENYRNDPGKVWEKIRPPSRNPAVLGRLRALAAWRDPKRWTRTSRAAASCATKPWPTLPATRRANSLTWPKCAASPPDGRTTTSDAA